MNEEDQKILEERKVKALEKIANILDSFTIWFEDINKEEWSNRAQYYLSEFHDVIYEILTCSVFSIWYPLKAQWESEGEYLKYYSPVVWDTKYCTTVQRMERIDRIEKLFDKLGLEYNTYHRGLMLEEYENYQNTIENKD
jgi:hypothetical protein